MDWIGVSGLAVAAVAMLANALMVWISVSQKRSEYVAGVYQKLAENGRSELLERLSVNPDKELSAQEARTLESILALFDELLHMRMAHNVSRKDLDFVAVELATLQKKKVVQDFVKTIQDIESATLLNLGFSEGRVKELIPYNGYTELWAQVSRK